MTASSRDSGIVALQEQLRKVDLDLPVVRPVGSELPVDLQGVLAASRGTERLGADLVDAHALCIVQADITVLELFERRQLQLGQRFTQLRGRVLDERGEPLTTSSSRSGDPAPSCSSRWFASSILPG